MLEKNKDKADYQLPSDDSIENALYTNQVQNTYDGMKDKTGGMGSDTNKALDAVTSIITGALTGDIVGGLAGASAPYLAEEIKKQTEGNDTANAIAHAVLGAVVAELKGGSVLAGATGAAVGEVAANKIIGALYPGREAHELNESEKEYVLKLANLAAGLAGTVASGGSSTGVGSAIEASDNAVQNNGLNPYWEAVKALAKPSTIGAPVTINAEQVLMAQAGLTALQAREFLDSLSENERYLIMLAQVDPAGNDFFAQAVGETYNKYYGQYLTTIGVEAGDIPKLEGLPIPEENKGWSTTTPIPEQNKDDGKLSTPILEQDKNSGVLPGSEIEVGDWQDNLLTSKGKETTAAANDLGYGQRIPPQKAPFNSHGQPVYWNGKNYITPDIDGHNTTGGWKMFNRKGERVGTYDKDLNKIKG